MNGYSGALLCKPQRYAAADTLRCSGDQHYFADSSLPSYDAEATALLTKRVLDFLARV